MSREYPARPIVAVGVVVWRPGGELLLARRGKPPNEGLWSIPGGGLELGEALAEAAAREVREECGVEIGAPELLTALDFIERDEQGAVRFHYVLIDLLAPWAGGEPVAGDDASEVRWVTQAELADVELWSETRRVLELAFDRLDYKGARGITPRTPL